MDVIRTLVFVVMLTFQYEICCQSLHLLNPYGLNIDECEIGIDFNEGVWKLCELNQKTIDISAFANDTIVTDNALDYDCVLTFVYDSSAIAFYVPDDLDSVSSYELSVVNVLDSNFRIVVSDQVLRIGLSKVEVENMFGDYLYHKFSDGLQIDVNVGFIIQIKFDVGDKVSQLIIDYPDEGY